MFFFVKYDVLVILPLHDVCDVSEYLRLADSELFKIIQSPSHCLSHILPPEKNLSGLRSRGHDNYSSNWETFDVSTGVRT